MEFAVAATADPGERFMHRALEMARRGLAAGGPPVGACLVRDDVVLAESANAVIGKLDITAHAEVEVIRHACAAQRSLDLSGSTLYVTVEPCAMCLAACHYAGIRTIVFGASLAAMQAITGGEITLKPESLAADVDTPLQLHGGVLASECTALLTQWAVQRGAGARR